MIDCVIPLSLHLVDYHQMTNFIPHVRPHLKRMAAGSNGKFEETDIVTAIVTGRMQLWVVMRETAIACTVVTEVIQYPRRRALRFVGVVGHRWREWAHLVREIENVAARTFGCNHFEALAEPKWRHVLKNYSITHALFERDT